MGGPAKLLPRCQVDIVVGRARPTPAVDCPHPPPLRPAGTGSMYVLAKRSRWKSLLRGAGATTAPGAARG
eukprot:scaffold1139_cov202-Prasinococcus_capsulatus_cf.AAC.6